MVESSTCPQCGASATGTFCAQCGTRLTDAGCGGCGVELSPGARYCHRCGQSTGLTRPGRGAPMPWVVAGTVVVLLVAVIAIKAGGGLEAAAPDMANSGNQAARAPSGPAGPAPDISAMSPRERFDRLFERVMDAGARRDSATVVDFTPMALGAYQQLERYDDLARYRAALIRLQAGEFQGASALADTILTQTPGHLLGIIIQGTVAHFQGDVPGRQDAYRRFLENYQAAQASGLSEYQTEQAMIESFREAALADGSSD